MSTFSGPEISNSGLVLSLDAANTKSYNYNWMTYSQVFTNAVYSKSASVTFTTGLQAPNGTLTAITVTDPSTTVYEQFYRSFTVPNDSASYNVSIYIKKTTGATSPKFGMNAVFTGGTTKPYYIRFNTDTGIVIGGDANLVTSENYNYWRLSFTISNNTTGNTVLTISVFPAVGPYTTNLDTGTDSITATGSQTVWGLQLTTGTALVPYLVNVNSSVTTLSDLSGNPYTGTLTNGSTYSSSNMGSIVFNGTSQYVTVAATSSTQFDADFTIESWVWIDSTVTSSRPDSQKGVTLFSSYPPAGGGSFLVVITGSTGTAGTGLQIYQDSTSIDMTLSQTVPLDSWVHLAIVRIGSTIYGYINGIPYTFTLVSGSSTALLGNSGTGSRIGAALNSSYIGYWKGYISNLRVYKNKGLSAEEILRNFRAFRGRYSL